MFNVMPKLGNFWALSVKMCYGFWTFFAETAQATI